MLYESDAGVVSRSSVRLAKKAICQTTVRKLGHSHVEASNVRYTLLTGPKVQQGAACGERGGYVRPSSVFEEE